MVSLILAAAVMHLAPSSLVDFSPLINTESQCLAPVLLNKGLLNKLNNNKLKKHYSEQMVMLELEKSSL